MLSAVCVTAKECATNSKFPERLQKGEYQIVFSSPEALFLTTEWKILLIYPSNLVGYVIDEPTV